jgi:uncharacterized protein YbaP (TraB family)
MKRALIILTLFAGAFTSNAQLLWKVSGNGLHKPSYLFGTHHIADQTICDGIKGFNDAYNSIEQLYGEVDTEKMNRMATQLKMLTHMKMPKGQTLSSLYTEDQLKVVDEFVTSVLGVGVKSFDAYKPVMVSSSLQVFIAMKVYPDFNAEKAIDSHMQAMAKKAKGTTVVEAQVLDTSTGLTLSMKSQNMRVTPSKFIPWLREMPGVVEVKPVTH